MQLTLCSPLPEEILLKFPQTSGTLNSNPSSSYASPAAVPPTSSLLVTSPLSVMTAHQAPWPPSCPPPKIQSARLHPFLCTRTSGPAPLRFLAFSTIFSWGGTYSKNIIGFAGRAGGRWGSKGPIHCRQDGVNLMFQLQPCFTWPRVCRTSQV